MGYRAGRLLGAKLAQVGRVHRLDKHVHYNLLPTASGLQSTRLRTAASVPAAFNNPEYTLTACRRPTPQDLEGEIKKLPQQYLRGLHGAHGHLALLVHLWLLYYPGGKEGESAGAALASTSSLDPKGPSTLCNSA